ncbi:MAG TPA: toluene hydroxylase [Acidimicrobiia bacterium]|nr:toluene hydroxylase [Acidimicrobiia bacterium]
MTAPAFEKARRLLLNPAFDEAVEPFETRRTMGYYANPYRKRISEYEKVLLYAQPNPDWIPGGLGLGGWTGKFAGGRGSWENYFTEARCSDWFAFRDPGSRWEQPYVREKAEEWREAQRFMDSSAAEHLHDDIDPEWADPMITRYLGAFVHHEYGLFMAHASVVRDTFTDVLRVAVGTGALDHLDTAQMIQAEKMFLAQVRDDVVEDIAPGKDAWLNDPALRGARTVVERLWGESYDPVETLFGMYMVYEPLFGRFARRELFHHHAALHGDHFTARTLWSALRAGDAASRWVFDLFERVLAGDPHFASYNVKVMRMWAETWVPLTLSAMADLMPLWGATERMRAASAGPVRAAQRVVGEWTSAYAPVFGWEASADELLGELVR